MTAAWTRFSARRRQARLPIGAISIALAMCLLHLGCASRTPVPSGSLTGIAVDNDGNALPGITVSLQTNTGKIVQEVFTSENGSYRFVDVPAGHYRVTTTFAGFTAAEPLPVTVAPGAAMTLPRLVLSPPT